MKRDLFNQIANMTRPLNDNDKFLLELQEPGYALETLVNGNVSECIRYINTLISHDIKNANKHFETRTFILSAFDELNLIKDSELIREDQYKYILSKISKYDLKP